MVPPKHHRLYKAAAVTGLYFVISVFMATGTWIYGGPPVWVDIVAYSVRMLPWVPLTFVVLRLGRRFPLRGRRWPANLAVLIGGAGAVSFLGPAASYAMYLVVGPWLQKVPKVFAYWNSFGGVFWCYFHNNILIYGVIVAVGWGIDSFRKYRVRELQAGRIETELARARLQVLKSQVHPHFLFNTLHMISTIVYQDPLLADRMIQRLSDLLRATLDQADRQTISLREELELLKLYLEIMQARFGDRLNVSFEIQDETLSAAVPSFILQPLTENAIRYGIMPREEGGRVTIRARRDGGRLSIRVEDDGAGWNSPPEKILSSGLGLKNTISRLRTLYGQDQEFRLQSGRDGGAHVALEIPFRNDGIGAEPLEAAA
jgi:two-component sensor histidine kinase